MFQHQYKFVYSHHDFNPVGISFCLLHGLTTKTRAPSGFDLWTSTLNGSWNCLIFHVQPYSNPIPIYSPLNVKVGETWVRVSRKRLLGNFQIFFALSADFKSKNKEIKNVGMLQIVRKLKRKLEGSWRFLKMIGNCMEYIRLWEFMKNYGKLSKLVEFKNLWNLWNIWNSGTFSETLERYTHFLVYWYTAEGWPS